MPKIKIAYFGSSDFSARLLEKLVSDPTLPIEVKCVVTQPDKPVGRKQIITPTPVKLTAQKYHITVLDSMIHDLSSIIKECDFALVYAYAHKIPKEFLDLPKYGFIGIHPSLLPKYRGASPMTYALIMGENKTGVSLIKMDEEIDTGPTIAQRELTILPDEKLPNLEIRLTDLAFEMIKTMCSKSFNFNPSSFIFHHSSSISSYAPRLTKDDGYIELEVFKKSLRNEPLTFDELPNVMKKFYAINNLNSKTFHVTRYTLYNVFRGLYRWPGLWTLLRPEDIGTSEGQASLDRPLRLKIANMALLENKLIINKVQLEGKKEVDFKTFNKAYKIM